MRCTRCGLETGLETDGATAAANIDLAAAGWNRRFLPSKTAKVIRRAIAFIEDDAATVKECATLGGAWTDEQDKAVYDQMQQLAHDVRAIL